MTTDVGITETGQLQGSKAGKDVIRHELECAILRVKNKGIKMSISAVAREAGVGTASNIHVTYPDIAEKIRTIMRKGVRQQREAVVEELKAAQERNRGLQADLDKANQDLARMASINQTLRDRVALLEAQAKGQVIVLPNRRGV